MPSWKDWNNFKTNSPSQVLVAHACNPSYLGGSDQVDCSLKPARAKKFARPYLKKKPNIKEGCCSGSSGRATA
jgi:hypothetical protein